MNCARSIVKRHRSRSTARVTRSICRKWSAAKRSDPARSSLDHARRSAGRLGRWNAKPEAHRALDDCELRGAEHAKRTNQLRVWNGDQILSVENTSSKEGHRY